MKHVDTIHELYLRFPINIISSFFQTQQHFVNLPDYLQKQHQRIRRKMIIPMAMGKLKHQISKNINILTQIIHELV